MKRGPSGRRPRERPPQRRTLLREPSLSPPALKRAASAVPTQEGAPTDRRDLGAPLGFLIPDLLSAPRTISKGTHAPAPRDLEDPGVGSPPPCPEARRELAAPRGPQPPSAGRGWSRSPAAPGAAGARPPAAPASWARQPRRRP